MFCLLHVFEQQHLMDHGQLMLGLQLHQDSAHRLADMLRVGGFSAQDDAKTKDGINRLDRALGQRRRYGRNLERARHTHDFSYCTRFGQFRLGRS